MNQRSAKLLRRYAGLWGVSPKAVKENWEQTPRNKRHDLRLAMQSALRNRAKADLEAAR